MDEKFDINYGINPLIPGWHQTPEQFYEFNTDNKFKLYEGQWAQKEKLMHYKLILKGQDIGLISDSDENKLKAYHNTIMLGKEVKEMIITTDKPIDKSIVGRHIVQNGTVWEVIKVLRIKDSKYKKKLKKKYLKKKS